MALAPPKDNTTSGLRDPRRVLTAYEAIVELASSAELVPEVRRMRATFEKRAGAFGPEDAWFEPRSRAFWDDALTTQGFAALAQSQLSAELSAVAAPFARAHRGVFVVEDVDRAGAHLVDLWSGAELLVRHLDEAQATSLTHAEGAMDARVVADGSAESASLYVLPGALHHGPDALEPIGEVLAAARDRDMATGDVLDALLRMERAFRSSSRVKAAFAYRTSALPAAAAG